MTYSPQKGNILAMKTFHRLKKEVGLSVLKKHKNKCSKCESEENLCVHHIERMKPTDKRYNEESNLTVLCRPCHMKFHRESGHIITRGGRRGSVTPIICHCGKPQHAKGLCRTHYRLKFKEKWYAG